jgi:hypothetical protein
VWAQIHSTCLSVSGGHEWSALRSGPFNPKVIAVPLVSIGGWGNQNAVVDVAIQELNQVHQNIAKSLY